MQSDDQTRRDALNLIRSTLGDKTDVLSDEAVELMVEFYAIVGDPNLPSGKLPPRAKEILGLVLAEASAMEADEPSDRAAIRLALDHANTSAKIARESFEAALAEHAKRLGWTDADVRSARTAFHGHTSDVNARHSLLNMLNDPSVAKRVDDLLLSATDAPGAPNTRDLIVGITQDAMDTFQHRQHDYVIDSTVPEVERAAMTRIGKAGL